MSRRNVSKSAEAKPTGKDEYLSINRVALVLDISVQTIKRWYKWWESPEFKKPEDLTLPPYYHMDRRKTKFFKSSDIPYLKEFRNKLQTVHRGVMSEFNAAYQWGDRGTAALERKGTSRKEVQGKMR